MTMITTVSRGFRSAMDCGMRDVLGVRQDFDIGAVQQQEHHEHGEHVDERNQRHVAARGAPRWRCFLMRYGVTFWLPRRVRRQRPRRRRAAHHPRKCPGTARPSVNNGGSSFWNSRTLSMVCTSTSYGMSCSMSTLAAITDWYLLFTNCRYSESPL